MYRRKKEKNKKKKRYMIRSHHFMVRLVAKSDWYQ